MQGWTCLFDREGGSGGSGGEEEEGEHLLLKAEDRNYHLGAGGGDGDLYDKHHNKMITIENL